MWDHLNKSRKAHAQSCKEMRSRKRQRGECYDCANPALPGRRQCAEHTSKGRKKRWEKFQSRRKAGLCSHCDLPTSPGKTRCELHLTKSREYATRGRRKIEKRFKEAQSRANVRGIKWELSISEYQAILTNPCHYCNLPNEVETGSGLDRLNNSSGYSTDNVVSCCTDCNVVRGGRFSPQEMLLHLGPAIRAVKSSRISKLEHTIGE